MFTNLNIATVRNFLSEAGWSLTEMGGGPWIVYGFYGELSF